MHKSPGCDTFADPRARFDMQVSVELVFLGDPCHSRWIVVNNDNVGGRRVWDAFTRCMLVGDVRMVDN